MNTFLLILASLAVFRLSEFVIDDFGPWGIFQELRDFLSAWPKLYDLATCYYCVSVWWSLVVSVFVTFTTDTTGLFPLWWMGISGGAGAIYRIVRKR